MTHEKHALSKGLIERCGPEHMGPAGCVRCGWAPARVLRSVFSTEDDLVFRASREAQHGEAVRESMAPAAPT